MSEEQLLNTLGKMGLIERPGWMDKKEERVQVTNPIAPDRIVMWVGMMLERGFAPWVESDEVGLFAVWRRRVGRDDARDID